MQDETQTAGRDSTESSRLRALATLAVGQTCLYGVIAHLSWRFSYDSSTTERPIVLVLVLFALAFAGYLVSIRIVTGARPSRHLLAIVLLTAVASRIVMLFSVPIQEIDIYRYLWDGAISTSGVSPFRYSPEQIRIAAVSSDSADDLQKLVLRRDRDPVLHEILKRVHFGELPTIYPPVSQAVFAVASITTPNGASVLERVFMMKAWLVGFDLATVLLVIGLLRTCGRPVGLCVIYAWCPLLLKEVANSGHLDAIAVFLTTLAIYLAARLLTRTAVSRRHALPATAHAALTAFVLALAVGAKLYPIVLAPLFLFVAARNKGWRCTVVPATVFAIATTFFLWPLFRETPPAPPAAVGETPAGLASISQSVSTVDPSLGVTSFLRRWEMNDFIFLLLVENSKPTLDMPSERTAWFSVCPELFRRFITERVARVTGVSRHEAPFLTARIVTTIAFILVALWLALRAAQAGDFPTFCEAGFLTLAWFWLLCPTQNPWYWLWALPLLPFARGRAWMVMSGLVLLYYLRFWLTYHWPDTTVLGTRYVGHAFFDFVVTWIEFAPWLLWLVGEACIRTRQQRFRDEGEAVYVS